MPILQIIIIQLIIFIGLVFVLLRVLYTASFSQTRRLQQLNRENAKKAEELAKKIEEATKEYEAKIRGAEDEARRLKAKGREEADRLKDDILERARRESDRIVQQAMNTKEKLKEEIMSAMNEACTEKSLQLVRSALNEKHRQLLHGQLIAEVQEQIKNMKAGRFEVTSDKGEISVPYDIGKTAVGGLANGLSEKLNRRITLESNIDKELVAGAVIKIGNLIIDGSLAGRLKEAAEALKST